LLVTPNETQALRELIEVALGRRQASWILRNVQLVNVYSAEIAPADVALYGDRIVRVEPDLRLPAARETDCQGMYAVPGFIDGHMHPEVTLLSPGEMARVLLAHGTTTICADCMEIANVFGKKGVEQMVLAARPQPLRWFLEVPARVPTGPGLETTGGTLGIEEIADLLSLPEAISLGELDTAKVMGMEDQYLGELVLASARGKLANGHASGVDAETLAAYLVAGPRDDHECTEPEELIQRVRQGAAVMARQGSSERNVEDLMRAVTDFGLDTRHIFFCTDDKHPTDLRDEGHIDYAVKLAIRSGVKPVEAIQMATLNAAEHFRLSDRLGSIAPGRIADILLLRDLDSFPPAVVIAGGEEVAREGEALFTPAPYDYPAWYRESVTIPPDLGPDRYQVPAPGRERVTVSLIEVIEGQILNRALTVDLTVRDGFVQPDVENDVLLVSMTERYGHGGGTGVAFIRGFGLKRGAIALSVAHDHHNVAAVAVNEQEMAAAVRALGEMGGGMVVVDGGQVQASLPLPLGGLMSDRPLEEVIAQEEAVNAAAHRQGVTLRVPFMTLSFVSLPTVPDLGLTDKGLVDVRTKTFVAVVRP
jgi:adenine deaminase